MKYTTVSLFLLFCSVISINAMEKKRKLHPKIKLCKLKRRNYATERDELLQFLCYQEMMQQKDLIEGISGKEEETTESENSERKNIFSVITSPHNIPCDISELKNHDFSFDCEGVPYINGFKIWLTANGAQGVVTQFKGTAVKLATDQDDNIVIAVEKEKIIVYYRVYPHKYFRECVPAERITKNELGCKEALQALISLGNNIPKT